MSSFDRFPKSAAGNHALHNRIIDWPDKPLALESHVYCAYNQTREQFLCANVELADILPENLREHLAILKPGTAKAFWLAPFHGISPNYVDSPIDLVFLDRKNCVFAAVESFPVAQPISCDWTAGTVLALPARSISSSGTLAGDQLVLCTPQKLERRFLNLHRMGEGDQENEDLSSNPHSVSHDFPRSGKATVQLTNWEELHQRPRPAVQALVAAPPAPPEQTPAPAAEPSKPAAEVGSAYKNWLFCLLAPHRRDKRKSPREFLPWIAAYYFNGGTPAPTSVRNISMNGMFVVTSERWYLGTIIRVTLSDWRMPSPRRSITINAMAVRWGDDGVGLRFVFQKPRRDAPADDPLVDVTPQELKEFLHRFTQGTHTPA